MATVTVDSELMYHQVAAQPFQVASGAPFSSVTDMQNRPLTLSVGTDNCLYALKADPTFENEHLNINVSTLIGAQGSVTHFAVSQDTTTKAIYLVFVAVSGATSTVYALPHFQPDDLVASNAATLVKPLTCTSLPPATAKVNRILLGDVITSGTYPLAIAVFTNPAGNTDIARILVSGTSWSWDGQLGMPEAATGGLMDICTGNTTLGVGIYCLYVNAGTTSLLFQTTEAGSRHYKFELLVPQSSQRIITYRESNSQTHLLIAGGGLFHISPDQAVHSGSQAASLSTDPLFQTVTKLYLSQHSTDFSMWFLSGTTLAYQQGLAGSPAVINGTPVSLLTQGATANFAAIIDPTTLSQSLVVLNTTSSLTIMEQPSDTLIWRTTPFLVKQLDKMLEFTSYTSRLVVVDAQGWPQGNKPFMLSTDLGWLTVIVNGTSSLLGTEAIPVTSNSNGAVTIIFPTDDLDAYVLHLTDASGSTVLGGQTIIFDPSEKVQGKLSGITSGDDLRSAKTAGGQLILQGSTAAPEDIDNVGKWIGELSNTAMMSIRAQKLLQASGQLQLSSASDVFWDGWNWVVNKATAAKDWFVDTVGDVWHFVVTIAGTVYDFVLDTAAKVVKAISWMLQKIEIAWDTMVQWLGYIFDWQDIMNTKNSIKLMVNGLLTFGSNYLKNEAQSLNAYFDQLQSQITQSFTTAPTATATPASQNMGDSPSLTSASKTSQSSAPVNYGNYQLDHGGAADASILGTFVGDTSLSNLYTQRIAPLLQQLLADAETIGSQIVDLFNQGLSITVADIQQFAKQFAIAFLQLIKDLVTNVVLLGADILQGLETILNTEFQIPVIGPLLESFGVGTVSILEAVALFLAIPATILAKIITGSNPVLTSSFDYQKLVDGTLDSTTKQSFSELAAYVDIPVQYVGAILKVKDIAVSTVPAEGAPPTPLSYFSLVKDLIAKGVAYPSDSSNPGWNFRISAWSMLVLNIVIKGVCKRAGVSAVKALACFDGFIALVNFSLNQASYGTQLNTSFPARDDTLIGIGIANSIFLLLTGVGSTYGTLAPDPIDKAIASVVVMGAGGCSCVLKGVKEELSRAKEAYNNLEEST